MRETSDTSKGPPRNRESRFSRIFEECYEHVLAYSIRRTNSKEDAQDVAGHVFELLWQKLDSLAPDAELLPWLYAVARRCLANRRRRQLTKDLHQGELRLRTELNPGSHLTIETQDEIRHLILAMERLSDQDRELLRLLAWEGLTHAQIGEAFGISENAVSIRIHRARSRLRDHLQTEETSAEVGND